MNICPNLFKGKIPFKIILMLAYVLALPLLYGQSDEHSWYETDIFPYIISSGPQKGQGCADLAVQLIDEQISDHQHEKIIMPSKRIQEEIKAGATALWPTAIRIPEREEFMYFSRPYVIIMPLKFVSFTGSGIPSDIDDQFFRKNPEYTVAVVAGRSYGTLINGMLKDVPGENLLYSDNLKDEISRIHKLLSLGRLTGFFAYEDEVNALCEEFGIPVEDFRFSRVAVLKYIMGSIAAPRTPWGRSIMERINSVIDKIKRPVALKYMQFLPPDSREEYLEISEELLEY